MSNAILEMNWPARGGGLLNGSFETTIRPGWDFLYGRGSVQKTSSETSPVVGTYSAKLSHSSSGIGIHLSQSVSNLSYYLGKRITFTSWVKINGSRANLILNMGGSNINSPDHSGLGDWERLRVSAIVPTTATQVQLRLFYYINDISVYAFFDGASLILGDTYGTVTIDESHIYPIDKPENVVSGSGELADGGIYGVENGVVIVDRAYCFEGLSESLYLKLRNFQRYVCCGNTYEFDYTDTDGTEYTARMLPSFADAKEVGPDCWEGTMNLRLTDKGIG